MISFTPTKEGAPIRIGLKPISAENPVNGGAVVFEFKRPVVAKDLRRAA